MLSVWQIRPVLAVAQYSSWWRTLFQAKVPTTAPCPSPSFSEKAVASLRMRSSVSA